MIFRIAELRAERGWTQDLLARKAGVSRSYLSELETGAKPVNDRRLQQIANALGVELIALFDLSKLSPTFQRLLTIYLAIPAADRDEWVDTAEHIGRAYRARSGS